MPRQTIRCLPLQEGDLVRVVSPSFPALALIAHRKARATQAMNRLGLRIDYGAHAFEVWDHFAGTPAQRAADINAAFADPEVSGILCSLGGTDSKNLLPLLDYDLIAQHPKVLIGHSNNVTLMLAMLAQVGLVTFHGPSFVNQFGEFPAPFPETLEGFRAACMTTACLTLRPMTGRTDVLPGWWHEDEDRSVRPRNLSGGWRWLVPGVARGPLIGGYLPYVLDLLDTEWCPSFQGAILFWDTIMSLNPLMVDGMLGELARRQILSQCVGLVVGVPARLMSPPTVATLEEVILKWAKVVDGPILVDADCGHTDPAWTLPLGVRGYLDSFNDQFTCESGTVSA